MTYVQIVTHFLRNLKFFMQKIQTFYKNLTCFPIFHERLFKTTVFPSISAADIPKV